jgi:hypothetical protein
MTRRILLPQDKWVFSIVEGLKVYHHILVPQEFHEDSIPHPALQDMRAFQLSKL